MDDGTLKPYGFDFATDSFTFAEVYKLAGIMHYNFGLICTVQSRAGKPILHITSGSKALFIS